MADGFHLLQDPELGLVLGLSTVLDDFSRHILDWKLTPTMNSSDGQDTLLLAPVKVGLDHVLVEHRPRLLSDNGPWYLSKDLKFFLEHQH